MKHIRRMNKGRPMGPDGRQLVPPPPPGPAADDEDVKAHAFFGCSILFEPGWETDSFNGLMGLCHPWQRDLYGCSEDCWWPAQVPDTLSTFPDFNKTTSTAEKDWQNVTIIEDDGSTK